VWGQHFYNLRLMIHKFMICLVLLDIVEGVRVVLLMIKFVHSMPLLSLYFLYVFGSSDKTFLLRKIGNVNSINLTNSLVEPSSKTFQHFLLCAKSINMRIQ
jgi:hypothetical protein